VKAETRSLAARAIAGVGWNSLGGLISSLCSLWIGIVLARILGPRPYGQVIVASTIYGFANLFVDGGFGQALIQTQELDEREIRRTFTCQIVFGGKTTAIVFVLAPSIARAFHDPSAVPVIQASGLVIVLQSLGLVSAALLRRRMQFHVIQYAGVASYLFGFLLLGIPLSLAGAGVWSLVAALLCQSLLNSLLLYCAVRHSIMPSFGLPRRSTLAFGGTVVANNLVNWGHANLDNLAAAQLGPVGLGLYGRACNFAYQPVNTAATALQSVLMASAARAQQREHVREMMLCTIAAVFGVLGCAYAVLAAIPDTAIVGLFGDKWVGVIPAILPLAMAMPFYGAHCLLGPIVCGLGRPRLEFLPEAISCAAGAAAFFAAGHYSIVAIAWVLFAVMLLRFGLTAGSAFRLLEIRWTRALSTLGRRALFAAMFGGMAWSADQVLRAPFHFGAEERLAILFLFCAGTLGWTVWASGELVFGHEAIAFLNRYVDSLPGCYAKQIQLQAGRRPSVGAVGPENSAEVAG